jgi:quercetin dioxygenase-like cupin family protein
MKKVVAALMISGSLFGSADAQQKDVVVDAVAQTDKTISGQSIKLPGGNAEVAVSIYNIVPGATLPIHRHKYPRYGYILSGELEVTNEETGKSMRFGPDDFVVESIEQWHKGTNPGTVPLRLLVIDQIPKGATNNVEVRRK